VLSTAAVCLLYSQRLTESQEFLGHKLSHTHLEFLAVCRWLSSVKLCSVW